MHAIGDTEASRELAIAALRCYSVPGYDLEFLRHNENLVYRVCDRATGQRYLLRIHLPGHEGFRGLQQTEPAIASELAWLRALRRDTGIPVQEPVANLAGELVTLLPAAVAGEGTPCTLLAWVEGKPFSQEGDRAEELAHRLGVLDARLHAHAQAWEHPEPFLRLSYDAELLRVRHHDDRGLCWQGGRAGRMAGLVPAALPGGGGPVLPDADARRSVPVRHLALQLN